MNWMVRADHAKMHVSFEYGPFAEYKTAENLVPILAGRTDLGSIHIVPAPSSVNRVVGRTFARNADG